MKKLCAVPTNDWNADPLHSIRVPQGNRISLLLLNKKTATLKRMPLFNFPCTWNQEGVEKFNPIQHRYLKNLKAQFIRNL